MVKGFVFSVVVVALVGCTQTGGVVKTGPDTYRVTSIAASMRGGPAGARPLALEEAYRYCIGMNKEILVTNVGQRDLNKAGAGSSDVAFRCLAKNDKDL